MLLAHAAQAQGTVDLYTINIDENGIGTYAEYSPAVVSTANLIASGSLASDVYVSPYQGVVYILPYTVTPLGSTDAKWLGIKDSDTAGSDLVSFQNFANGQGGQVGTMSLYSNDTDGDLADVTTAYWSSLLDGIGGWPGTSTTEDANGGAFYSTLGDPYGVPGDPDPHPTVEALYYIQSGTAPTPEPASLALLCSFAGMGLIAWVWRRRRVA
jgi:hypothetical protein